MSHTFSAAARVFCREATDHLPTTSEAVACPHFSDPAMRSRSGQHSVMRSSFQLALEAALHAGSA
ncbi:hypothetical protein ACBI99_43795 [Nonomuraea sp. ATR24]|uniref:hypothetical protein n=1 Tax=Nonomuraea TaxID=83681 RepID=UPI001FE8724A|nr:hypothetical protein [Nonomuraea ceibae]